MIRDFLYNNSLIEDELKEMLDFIEIDNVKFSFNEVFYDKKFQNGGIFSFIGLDIARFKNIIIISDNPFLGDNLCLTLPVANYLNETFEFENILVHFKHFSIFENTSNNIKFKDLEIDITEIQNLFLITNTLILTFNPAKLKCITSLIDLGYIVFNSLNDSNSIIYNQSVPIRSVRLNYFKSFRFTQDYIEGIRGQILFDYYKNSLITLKTVELIDMVNGYCDRVDLSLEDDDRWVSLLKLSPKSEMSFLYKNVYEYNCVMYKLLFGIKYKWINFSNLLNIQTPNDYRDISPEININGKFVFVNINVLSLREKLSNDQGGILDFLKLILNCYNSFNCPILINYPEFGETLNNKIFSLIHSFKINCKVDIIPIDQKQYWLFIMQKAHKIVSFDTGFVHLAYLLNKNVLSAGGQSFFWHFPGCNYVNMNHYDKNNVFLPDKFEHSVNEIIDWIKTND